MFDYQTTNTTVNLSFSKEFLSSSEVVKLIETLQIKELLSKSQLTTDDALKLDRYAIHTFQRIILFKRF